MVDAMDFNFKHFSRLIRLLKNELTVLLVSLPIKDDSQEKPAGVALVVDVGAFRDTVPGLAHFVEHMIFMGSEKYQSENEFEKHITVRILTLSL